MGGGTVVADQDPHTLAYELTAAITAVLGGIGSVIWFKKKKPAVQPDDNVCAHCPTTQEKIAKMDGQVKAIADSFIRFQAEHTQVLFDIREIKAENKDIHNRITTQGEGIYKEISEQAKEVSKILGILSTMDRSN